MSAMTSGRRKVCLLGLDGVRRREAFDEGGMPGLDDLAARGSAHDMTIEGTTVSGPSWSTILTGATEDEHGARDNSFLGSRLVRFPDLLSRAFYADQSVRTFAAADWPPLVDPDGLGPIVFERREQQRAGQHVLVVRDGERHGYSAADAQIAAKARWHLHHEGPEMSFIYLCEVDEAGHLGGPRSPAYADAMARVDAHVTGLVAEIAHRATAGEEWLVVVTTDHGHVDAGGHGGDSAEERASFVVACRFDVGGAAGGVPGWPERIRPVELSGLLLAWLTGA